MFPIIFVFNNYVMKSLQLDPFANPDSLFRINFLKLNFGSKDIYNLSPLIPIAK